MEAGGLRGLKPLSDKVRAEIRTRIETSSCGRTDCVRAGVELADGASAHRSANDDEAANPRPSRLGRQVRDCCAVGAVSVSGRPVGGGSERACHFNRLCLKLPSSPQIVRL